MFRNISVAEFQTSDGHKAQFIIDNTTPVAAVLEILQRLTHFCVERQKEAENELAQQQKDEEANKVPHLEAEPAPVAEEEVKE